MTAYATVQCDHCDAMEQFEGLLIRRIIGLQLAITVSKVIPPSIKLREFVQIFISACRVERQGDRRKTLSEGWLRCAKGPYSFPQFRGSTTGILTGRCT